MCVCVRACVLTSVRVPLLWIQKKRGNYFCVNWHMGCSPPFSGRLCAVCMFLPHSPNNCGTIFIPGDRTVQKRATRILPLLATTLRAKPPNLINRPQSPSSVTQQLEATVKSVPGLSVNGCLLPVHFLTLLQYESIRAYFTVGTTQQRTGETISACSCSPNKEGFE